MLGKRKAEVEAGSFKKKPKSNVQATKKSREYTFINEQELRRRVHVLMRKEKKGEQILSSKMEIQHHANNEVLTPLLFDVVKDRDLLEREFELVQNFDHIMMESMIESFKKAKTLVGNVLKISDISPEMLSLLTSPNLDEWKSCIARERLKKSKIEKKIRIDETRGRERKRIERRCNKMNKRNASISALYLFSSLSRQQISQRTSSTYNQVGNVIKKLKKEKKVPKSSLLSRKYKRKVTHSQIKILENLFENQETRDLSLRKKAQIMNTKVNPESRISAETVRKYANSVLDFKFKSVKLTNPEANSYLNRKRRKVVVCKILLSLHHNYELIFLDECGIGSKPLKERGWSRRGTGSKRIGPSKGKNISICAAITRNTVIAMEFSSRAYGELTFIRFFKEMLRFLKSSSMLRDRALIFLMDNAAFHKSALSTTFLRESGVGVLYNAPYSPQLNPCEYFFNHLKRELARDANIRM
jgi:hypothetical protein